MKMTPLPWRVVGEDGPVVRGTADIGESDSVAKFDNAKNAMFAVHAANNHKKLLNALKRAVRQLGWCHQWLQGDDAVYIGKDLAALEKIIEEAKES